MDRSAVNSAYQYVVRNADRIPEGTALEFEGRSLSYRELNSEANQFAHALHQSGVTPGSLIGLSVARSIDALIALYGILKAGCTIVPLDPHYPEDRLALMADTARLRTLITEVDLRPRFAGLKNVDILDLQALIALAAHQKPSAPEIPVSIDDLLYVIFTSGSTGRPKAVAMPHRPLINLVEWQTSLASELPHSARTLQFTTLSFDVAFQEIFSTACDGGTLVLMREELRYDPARLLTYLKEERIHRLFLPFVALNQLSEALESEEALPADLRQVITAGEALHATPRIRSLFKALPSARLHNHYGPSETHVATAFSLDANPDQWAALPSIGFPIANTEVHLRDENGQSTPQGEPGELFISGECLAQGYLHRDDLTQERFPSVRISGGASREVRAYRTGDLVRKHADGSLEFLGRKDHQVKIRGHRIELGEVEAILSTHNGVKECAVSVVDEGMERHLAAYIVGRTSPAGDKFIAELRAFLRSTLPDYAVPTSFTILRELPLTPSGKVDRRALPQPQSSAIVSHRSAPTPKVSAPSSSSPSQFERLVTEVWCEVLRISEVNGDANFFDLGGHSLLLTKVHRALEQRLHQRLSILDLFRYPTLRSLATHLATLKPSPLTPTLARSAENHEEPSHTHTASPSREPIAIIGMAGRWPGAENINELWNALSEGRETVSDIAEDVLRQNGVRDDQLSDPTFIRRRGRLPGVDLFDAEFFAFTPKDAAVTDPQHRLMLECVWEALEDAGIDPTRQREEIGVFAGSSLNTYFLQYGLPTRARVEEFTQGFQVDGYPLLVGNDKDYLATRIAYKLNLHGPALTIQTACSTSLVAIAQACASLWSGQCGAAIAGGVSLSFPQERGYTYQEGAIASSDGHCRAFDSQASGTVFSSGAGAVILKPLSKALEAGDRIYAVIRGAAVNNDGSRKVSFSAPSIEGQARVIRAALLQAGVSASSIGYVEAHGTGTPLGDPIEVAALKQAFGSETGSAGSCVLGSIKPNLGHLECAAGVTGLIKTALALYHESIPGTLHFKEPNPKCEFEGSPFRVSAQSMEWKRSSLPRRAGVSGFGVGGTNAHVILEEAPQLPQKPETLSSQLLILSARSPEALEVQRQQAIARLRAQPRAVSAFDDWAHITTTLQQGRQFFRHRRVVSAHSAQEAARALEAKDTKLVFTGLAPAAPRRVVFLFPGQGSQYPGMTQELYRTEPVFRAQMDRCCDALRSRLGIDLREILYPSKEAKEVAARSLRDTALAQPALFCVEFALAQLWMSWGVKPSILIGHSIGEYVAAVLADVMTPETALKLVAERGHRMQRLPGGAMLSVRLGAQDIERFLNAEIAIAAINSPQSCVLSGPTSAIEAVERTLSELKIAHKRLHTSHAFHSSMMDPMCAGFEEALAGAELRDAQLPIVSSCVGDWIEPGDWKQPGYWSRQVRDTVRFSQAIQQLDNEKDLIFLEVGPGQTLTALTRQNLSRNGTHVAIPSMPPIDQPEERIALLQALGRLWIEAVDVDWDAIAHPHGGQKTSFPSYPFERKRHWLETPTGTFVPSLAPAQILSAGPSPTPALSTEPEPTDSIEAVIRQQIHVMQQQLEMLAGNQDTEIGKAS